MAGRTWAYDVETDGRLPRGSIVLACAVEEGAEDQPLFFNGQKEAQQFLWGLGPDDTLIAHNAKYDLRATGVIPNCKVLDSLVLSWIYDPSGKHGLKHLSAEVLGTPLEDPIKVRDGQVFWRDYKTLIREAPIEEVRHYCYEDVLASLKLARLYEELLDEKALAWYWEWEEPFLKSLALMESQGLLIDEEKRVFLAEQFSADLVKKRAELFELVGYEFNTESPKQLAQVLYKRKWEDRERGTVGYYKRCEHKPDAARCSVVGCSGPKPKEGWVPVSRRGYGFKPAGHTATGQSATDSKALAEHAGHPAVDTLLEVRELQKLLSTYLLAFPEHMHEGRLFGSFNGTGTATGRLSSSEPNLQNIPARGEHGKLIRSLFIAAPGHKLVVADLQAIEFRLLADFAQEEVLLEAFYAGEDVHAATASRNGIDRTSAKTFGYSLAYEAGPKTVAQRLRLPLEQVRPMWEKFKASLPRTAEWKEQVREETRRKGYVELPSGRRRYLPDINYGNSLHPKDREAVKRRAYAERQAVNTWPQGTAADILKISQVLLQRQGLTPLAQVHDELLFEVPEEAAAEVVRVVKEVMEGAGAYLGAKVPIVCEPKIVDRWSEKE